MFDALNDVSLETSWVLGIEDHPRELTFLLDAVLLPSHRHYRPPQSDEHACYRRARLKLVSDTVIMFRRSARPPGQDSTGEPDYGQIDSFCVPDQNEPTVWEVVGAWGEAFIARPTVTLDLEP